MWHVWCECGFFKDPLYRLRKFPSVLGGCVFLSWRNVEFYHMLFLHLFWWSCSFVLILLISSVQFSGQSCPTLCDPMNFSTPGLPVHHQLPEFTQTHIHRVSDAVQPSHPLSSPSPPAPNPSQHQSLFQWVNSSHEVAKVLEFNSIDMVY